MEDGGRGNGGVSWSELPKEAAADKAALPVSPANAATPLTPLAGDMAVLVRIKAPKEVHYSLLRVNVNDETE